jgi:WXG100 family type VII secretion target
MSSVKVTPEQLTSLSSTLKTEASQVASVKSKIASSISSTDWDSPAANRFKADWNGKYVKALTELERALTELGVAASTMAQNYIATEAAYKGGS